MPFQPGNKLAGKRGTAVRRRAMSAILESEGRRAEKWNQDRPVQARRLLARRLWDAVTNGEIKVGNHSYVFDQREWFELVKFVYMQVDGQPKQMVEMSGDASSPVVITTPEDRERAILEMNEWRRKQIEQLSSSSNQVEIPLISAPSTSS